LHGCKQKRKKEKKIRRKTKVGSGSENSVLDAKGVKCFLYSVYSPQCKVYAPPKRGFQALKALFHIHTMGLKVGIACVNPYLYNGSIHTGMENASHTTTHKYPNNLILILLTEPEPEPGVRPALRTRSKTMFSRVIAVAWRRKN
jgi:hypothetical protein